MLKRFIVGVFLAIYVIFNISCTGPFTIRSYKTLATTAEIVNTGRAAYHDLWKNGQIDQEFDDKVAKAYTAYQVGMRAAVLASETYDALIKQNVEADPSVANARIEELEVLVNDVIKLFVKAKAMPKTEYILLQRKGVN